MELNMFCGYGKWPLFHVFALTFILRGNSTFIERPVDTKVFVGDSTYLNCSISSNAPAEALWYHSPVGEGTSKARSVYSSGKIFNPYTERFKIEKGALNGTFDLVIKKAKLSDAGLYVCQIRGTTKWTIAQLTVLESAPVWMTNIRSRGFIGINSCGLKSDTIRLSCSINYRGNVTPKLQMTLVQYGERIAVNESHLSCASSDISVICNYSTEATHVMDESYFICYANTSENTHRKDKTGTIKIIYAGYTSKCPVNGIAKDKSWSFWEWSYLVRCCITLVLLLSIFRCGMPRSYGDMPSRPNNDYIRLLLELRDLLGVQSDIDPMNNHLRPMTEKEELMEENDRLREALNCKVCWDEEADTVLLPCGHLICCSICSSEVSICPCCRKSFTSHPVHRGTRGDHQQLDLYNHPLITALLPAAELVKENARLREALNCKLCMNKEADTIFLPCGHLIYCTTCSPEVDSCPLCGTVSGQRVRTYLS